MVEKVEGFGSHFDVHALVYGEQFCQPEINVVVVGIFERSAGQPGDTSSEDVACSLDIRAAHTAIDANDRGATWAGGGAAGCRHCLQALTASALNGCVGA